MVEFCPSCGERAVVFVVANKWRCKKCGKYFDWTQIKGNRQKPAGAAPPAKPASGDAAPAPGDAPAPPPGGEPPPP